jgi:hypothetical protein
MAELQRANVGDDPPPVIYWYPAGIRRHGAEPVRHHIEEVPHRRLPEFVRMVRGGLAESALHDHPLPVPNPAVTRRAEDVVSFLPAPDIRPRNWKRKLRHIRSVHLSGEARRIGAQVSPRNGILDHPRDARPSPKNFEAASGFSFGYRACPAGIRRCGAPLTEPRESSRYFSTSVTSTGAKSVQEQFGRVQIESRIARLDAKKEPVLRCKLKSRDVEHRMIRLRQPIQRKHPDHGVSDANNTVISNIGGMYDGQL